ncbi:hypothetical protein BDB01DRAFT_839751 [Pilobolus umbonatus]|nr:hypothetical protein BDB01DRAFT_839751 [Pilobolus umbonatus]
MKFVCYLAALVSLFTVSVISGEPLSELYKDSCEQYCAPFELYYNSINDCVCIEKSYTFKVSPTASEECADYCKPSSFHIKSSGSCVCIKKALRLNKLITAHEDVALYNNENGKNIFILNILWVVLRFPILVNLNSCIQVFTFYIPDTVTLPYYYDTVITSAGNTARFLKKSVFSVATSVTQRPGISFNLYLDIYSPLCAALTPYSMEASPG